MKAANFITFMYRSILTGNSATKAIYRNAENILPMAGKYSRIYA